MEKVFVCVRVCYQPSRETPAESSPHTPKTSPSSAPSLHAYSQLTGGGGVYLFLCTRVTGDFLCVDIIPDTGVQPCTLQLWVCVVRKQCRRAFPQGAEGGGRQCFGGTRRRGPRGTSEVIVFLARSRFRDCLGRRDEGFVGEQVGVSGETTLLRT